MKTSQLAPKFLPCLIFATFSVAATTTISRSSSAVLSTRTTVALSTTAAPVTLPTTPPASSTSDNSSSTVPLIPDTPIGSEPVEPGRSHVGAIVGAVIGAVALVCMVLAGVRYVRVRRRPKVPVLYPLIQDDHQPTSKKDRLEQVRNEKAAAQRHRDQLQSDLERNHTGVPELRRQTSNEGQSDIEALLRVQVQAMSQRILELEAQQEDLEVSGGPSVPPPDYTSATRPSGLRNI